MKPLTPDNLDGRTLLALRAGPMTPGEVAARVGGSVSRWLIESGLVEQGDSYYRITEAGRAACPLRNPLAARHAVPATSSEDESMNKTPQQVLDVIAAAGSSGLKVPEIAARFGLTSADKSIRNALYRLKSSGQVETPEQGLYVVASQGVKLTRSGQSAPARKVVEKATGKAMHATREAVMAWLESKSEGVAAVPLAIAHGIGCTEDSTRAVLSGLYAGLKVNRQKNGNDWAYFIGQPTLEIVGKEPVEACVQKASESSPQPTLPSTICAQAQSETASTTEELLPASELTIPEEPVEEIEIKPVPDRRAPILVEDEEDIEIGIFSSGQMSIQIEDGLNETEIRLSAGAVVKLRRFLGLFQEAA